MVSIKIEIDLEAYKALENQRISFEESHNDILHRLIDQMQQENKPAEPKTGGGLMTKGVFLHTGTKLRHIAKRTSERHDAVVEDGGIRYQGEIYHSPSQAAYAAAGGSRNGWTFWEYYDETNNKWVLLDALRGD